MENQEFLGDSHIGGQLSDARFRAGMTIADIAAHTKIATRYLEAIEREDFECLPSRCHTIGFTRAFARAVKADEAEVIDALRQKFLDDTSTEGCDLPVADRPDPMLTPLATAVQSCTSFLTGGFGLLAGRAAR